MILGFAGAFQVMVGIVWLLVPARKKSGHYGYSSYLAAVSDDAHRRAQRWAVQALVVTGVIEAGLGWAIHQLNWDRFFFLWLLVAITLFLPVFVYTEGHLKAYLTARGELPTDYVDPDVALKQKSARPRTKGLRDRLK